MTWTYTICRWYMPRVFAGKTSNTKSSQRCQAFWHLKRHRLPNQSGGPQNLWLWISTLNGGTSPPPNENLSKNGFLTNFGFAPFQNLTLIRYMIYTLTYFPSSSHEIQLCTVDRPCSVPTWQPRGFLGRGWSEASTLGIILTAIDAWSHRGLIPGIITWHQGGSKLIHIYGINFEGFPLKTAHYLGW